MGAQADGMANLLLVLACVFVLAALVLQGCLTETGNKAEIQAVTCNGTFSTSQGPDVIVTYDAEQGAIGAIYTCQSSQKCSYFVSDSNDEFKCDNDTISLKPDGKGDWQEAENGAVVGACLCENATENTTENGTENATERLFSVGDGPLPDPTPTKQYWSHTAFVVAAVGAVSVLGKLGAAASRRVPEGGTLAPDTESASE